MKSHWIKRIVRLLVLLFGVSILCFILTALSSTDPATYLVRRGNLSPTPEVIEQVRAELGLDQPLPIRYLNWIGGVFRGDFGESIFSTNEVAADLAAYFPQTLQLVFLSLAEIIVFSILLGVLCAAKKNKLTDHIMRIVSLFGICVPPFWLGFLLLIGFAVEIPIFSVTPASGIMGLILPSITLSFPVICSTVRVFRASLLEEMHRDYVSFARANGMTVNRILWKKVFRNALPPVITLFCQYVSYLIAGSAVVEKVFSIKGVGNYLMNCIIVHHLIPNILPQFLVYFSTGVASAILTVSSFSFLGLGLPSGTAEWGAMLEEAQVALYSHPELLIYPGICIFIAAAGFNLFGEALRDILQPQEDVL